jgi:hypothetical protein
MSTWIKRTDAEPPKDGTSVLVGGRYEITMAAWSPIKDEWVSVSSLYPVREVWRGWTHWMPIPPLPEDHAQ